MVDDGALEFGKRGKALVEVPLVSPAAKPDFADAERASAFGSGDLEAGHHQPIPSIDAPVVGTDPLEGHRHLVLHLGASLVDTSQYQSLGR